MTLKVVCDGCNRDISACNRHSVTISYRDSPNVPPDALGKLNNFDLCDTCLHQFEEGLPNRWPRAVPCK